jgi:hypothetical protein
MFGNRAEIFLDSGELAGVNVRTLTRTVDMYDYVVSDLVPEFLHERIEHITVLLDRISRSQDNVLSKIAPCEWQKLETVHRAVAC